MRRQYSRSDNLHISCARVIDWLRIWYLQSVDKSDLGIDWRKKLSLFVNNLNITNWALLCPPSLNILIYVLIKYIKNMGGIWSLEL